VKKKRKGRKCYKKSSTKPTNDKSMSAVCAIFAGCFALLAAGFASAAVSPLMGSISAASPFSSLISSAFFFKKLRRESNFNLTSSRLSPSKRELSADSSS